MSSTPPPNSNRRAPPPVQRRRANRERARPRIRQPNFGGPDNDPNIGYGDGEDPRNKRDKPEQPDIKF